MADAQQSFQHHTRNVPAFHFFALPVLIVNVGVAIWAAVHAPGLASAWQVVLAAALLVGALFGRVFALTAQDRLIRLEETLRMRQVLPAAQQGDIAKLTRYQFVALRFASDEELPDLVRRTVAGELPTLKAIKGAIRNWRPDHIRV